MKQQGDVDAIDEVADALRRRPPHVEVGEAAHPRRHAGHRLDRAKRISEGTRDQPRLAAGDVVAPELLALAAHAHDLGRPLRRRRRRRERSSVAHRRSGAARGLGWRGRCGGGRRVKADPDRRARGDRGVVPRRGGEAPGLDRRERGLGERRSALRELDVRDDAVGVDHDLQQDLGVSRAAGRVGDLCRVDTMGRDERGRRGCRRGSQNDRGHEQSDGQARARRPPGCRGAHALRILLHRSCSAEPIGL